MPPAFLRGVFGRASCSADMSKTASIVARPITSTNSSTARSACSMSSSIGSSNRPSFANNSESARLSLRSEI